jgi:hypothetical protein
MNDSAFKAVQACCRPAAGLQPWNSLLLAINLDPQSLMVGSQLGLQKRPRQWLGKRSAAICIIHLQVVILVIILCALASGQHPYY